MVANAVRVNTRLRAQGRAKTPAVVASSYLPAPHTPRGTTPPPGSHRQPQRTADSGMRTHERTVRGGGYRVLGCLFSPSDLARKGL